MRYINLAVLSLIILGAAPAEAVVVARVELRIGLPDGQPIAPEVFLDPGPDDSQNERLASFQIKLDLSNSSPDGVRFAGTTAPVQHPPVFPGVPLQDLGSDYDTLFVSAALPPGEGRDVTNLVNGLFAAVLMVPRDTPMGRYLIAIDAPNTAFFDSSGARLPFVIDTTPGGIDYIPEPAALSLLAPAALLALRRRRRSFAR